MVQAADVCSPGHMHWGPAVPCCKVVPDSQDRVAAQAMQAERSTVCADHGRYQLPGFCAAFVSGRHQHTVPPSSCCTSSCITCKKGSKTPATMWHHMLALPHLICTVLLAPACVQLKDGRVNLNEVVVMQPANTASHPYLSAQHHPELLLEAVSGRVDVQCSVQVATEMQSSTAVDCRQQLLSLTAESSACCRWQKAVVTDGRMRWWIMRTHSSWFS